MWVFGVKWAIFGKNLFFACSINSIIEVILSSEGVRIVFPIQREVHISLQNNQLLQAIVCHHKIYQLTLHKLKIL